MTYIQKIITAGTNQLGSAPVNTQPIVDPRFADINSPGIGDSTSFSAQALFGAQGANSGGLPQGSLDFIDSLDNGDVDVDGLVGEGGFSQSTLNVLRGLAE